ncbi:hypothetical protein [Sphingomonas sp. Leaf343]|uniref:hypothetical protein n=1 Tax=Sphingomonas sp. Leaf343 TaxID=1736345 RepID=UPI000AB60275|nr:hypothetical protein [Sphingomonas sp. Leaf343]
MAIGEPTANLDSETPDPAARNVSAIVNYTPPTNDTPDSMTRKWVSYLLLLLLSVVVILSFIQLFTINGAVMPRTTEPGVMIAAVTADTAADADRLMRLMNVVFGPVVTLFSSVVGFYFGARTAKDAGAS